jgi:hypothetical protein
MAGNSISSHMPLHFEPCAPAAAASAAGSAISNMTAVSVAGLSPLGGQMPFACNTNIGICSPLSSGDFSSATAVATAAAQHTAAAANGSSHSFKRARSAGADISNGSAAAAAASSKGGKPLRFSSKLHSQGQAPHLTAALTELKEKVRTWVFAVNMLQPHVHVQPSVHAIGVGTGCVHR